MVSLPWLPKLLAIAVSFAETSPGRRLSALGLLWADKGLTATRRPRPRVRRLTRAPGSKTHPGPGFEDSPGALLPSPKRLPERCLGSPLGDGKKAPGESSNPGA